MKLAIGIFKRDETGYDLEIAYHDGYNTAIIFIVNRESIISLWSNIKRKTDNFISDMFTGLALNRVNRMAGI